MKRKLLGLIGLWMCHLCAFAQQDAQFTQYMFNQQFLNPAFVGIEKETQISFIHRSQWVGYNPSFDTGNSPSTQVLSANTWLPGFNSGIGIHAVNDRLGPVNNQEIQLSYAYQINVGSEGTLALGVRGGLYVHSIDFTLFRALDEGDLLIPDNLGKQSISQADMAAGIYYNSPTFFSGIAVNHLLPTKFDFGIEGLDNSLVYSANLLLGFHYDLSNILSVTPSVLVKAPVENIETFSFDASAIATYDERFWAGLAYRYQDAATVMVGAYIPLGDNTLNVGYAFDYVVGGQEAKQPTSHEITVSYAIPVFDPSTLPPVRTPRFRYPDKVIK